MKAKYVEILTDEMRREPDNARNYYQYLNITPDSIKFNPANREDFEPFYQKIIQVKPNNIHYLLNYAYFLNRLGDGQKAFPLMKSEGTNPQNLLS